MRTEAVQTLDMTEYGIDKHKYTSGLDTSLLLAFPYSTPVRKTPPAAPAEFCLNLQAWDWTWDKLGLGLIWI